MVPTQTQLPSTGLCSRREFSFFPRGCLPSGIQKSLDRLHFQLSVWEKIYSVRTRGYRFSAVGTRMHAFLSKRVVGRSLGGWLERASRWPVEREREPIAAIFPRLRPWHASKSNSASFFAYLNLTFNFSTLFRLRFASVITSSWFLVEQCPYNYIYGALLLGECHVHIIIYCLFERLISHYFPCSCALWNFEITRSCSRDA